MLTLHNEHISLQVIPEVGGSIARLQGNVHGQWQDVLRPTPPQAVQNPSAASSFLMLPWVNRIQHGQFSFDGTDYQLQTTPDDGTARHGDVRKRPWQVKHHSDESALLTFDSRDAVDINWPFPFRATLAFTLDRSQVHIETTLINTGNRAMPCGLGHHPYFVRPAKPQDLQVTIPAAQYFPLSATFIPLGSVEPVTAELDFREARHIHDDTFNHILTAINHTQPIKLNYTAIGMGVRLWLDDVYKHVLLFTPAEDASIAIEPMTLVTNGFNLSLPSQVTGQWVLLPDESRSASFTIAIESL